MQYKESTVFWKWRYFTAPDIPDMPEIFAKEIGETLELPDGRKIKGESFDFAAGGIVDLRKILPRKEEVRERIIITGDFVAEEDAELLLGVAFYWSWTLRFNGKMLLDATSCGNSEMPLQTNNHLQRISVKKGKNQILWEVFGGSCMLLACKIMGEWNMPVMQYPPFVTFPDAGYNAVSIVFAANRNIPAALEYRLAGSGEWKRKYDEFGGQIRHDRKVHSIRLQDLLPGKIYEYRAVLSDDSDNWKEYTGETYTLKTPPSKGDFSFVVTADLQSRTERTGFLKDLLGKRKTSMPDFFVFCGDLFWSSNFDLTVMDEFIVPYREITENQLPLVMVRGNHEIYGKESFRYFEYFTPPEECGREGYYMFRWGEVCFIVLDFCDDAPRMVAPSTRQYHEFAPYLEREKKWLEKAVMLPECKEAGYRIVLAHGVPVGDATSYMPENIRKVIDPVFGGSDPLCRIHLWLGGHTHRPMRSIPLENAFYGMLAPEKFIKGNPLLPVGKNYVFPVVVTGGPNRLLEENMQFTSIEVKVSDKGLLVKSFDRYQKEFDSFIILPDGSVREIQRAEEYKKREY